MSVRQVACKDLKTIKNGTTTIVIAGTEIRYSEQFEAALMDIRNLVFEYPVYITRGVSKLHPDDSYDELTGKIVASKKAEIKGNKRAQNNLKEIRRLLKIMLEEVDEKTKNLEAREVSLTNSLKKD